MKKNTSPVPLKGYALKDREDIIKYIVNKEDGMTGFTNEIPERLKANSTFKMTAWCKAAMRYDITVAINSILP